MKYFWFVGAIIVAGWLYVVALSFRNMLKK